MLYRTTAHVEQWTLEGKGLKAYATLNPPTEEQRDGDAPALRLPGGAEPVGGGRTGP